MLGVVYTRPPRRVFKFYVRKSPVIVSRDVTCPPLYDLIGMEKELREFPIAHVQFTARSSERGIGGETSKFRDRCFRASVVCHTHQLFSVSVSSCFDRARFLKSL